MPTMTASSVAAADSASFGIARHAQQGGAEVVFIQEHKLIQQADIKRLRGELRDVEWQLHAQVAGDTGKGASKGGSSTRRACTSVR